MKITLFAHGTRGDVAPVVALGWTLAQQGHEVTVAVPDEFRDFARRAGLETAHLPLNMTADLRSPEGQRMLYSGGLSFLRRWARKYDRHADELDEAHRVAAEGAEALVANHLTFDRAVALSDALKIPAAFFIPFPLAPSREYSPLVTSRGKLRSPALRMAAHNLAIWVWWRQIGGTVDAFRANLGLEPSTEATVLRVMRDPRYLTLYALSPSIFPRPSDWPGHLNVTPIWRLPDALRADLGESLPPELEDWLEAGEPPVFLGFGSMPVIEPGPLLDDIVAVTGELGLRAIVSGNCIPADVPHDALPDRLFVVGTVDHDRLFARCSAAVHHGGIGSLNASLGAGLPTMVCSAMGDQPWWGEHMKRLGVGTHVPFRRLDRDSMRSGLTTLRDPVVVARAGELGEAIQAEGDGLSLAGQLIDDWLATPSPDEGRFVPA